MVEVEMTKDIHEYDPKLMGLITTRQLVLLLIGLAYSIPIAFLLPVEDLSIKILVMAFLMFPVLVCGWMNMQGMKMEQFVAQVVKSVFLHPQKRLYKIEGSAGYLQEEKAKAQEHKKIKPSSKYKAWK